MYRIGYHSVSEESLKDKKLFENGEAYITDAMVS